MKSKPVKMLTVVSILGMIFCPAVFAQSGAQTYIGVQYAVADYEDDLFSGVDPSAAILRYGQVSDEGVGFEGRFGIGLSEGDDSFFDPFFGEVEGEIDINHLIGFYLVGRAEAGANASVYGIIGVTQVDVDLTLTIPGFGSFSDDEDESDLSYGFGATFGKPGDKRFNIEYMMYLDKDDFETSAISLGLIF